MHRAPVVSILVLDGRNIPLPEPLEVAHDLSKSPDMQGSHQLLVVSEEQFKVTIIQEVCVNSCLKPATVLHSVQWQENSWECLFISTVITPLG